MRSHYQKLVFRLLSYVVRLFTCISPSTLINGRVTVTLSFAWVVMLRGYSLAGTMPCCSPSHRFRVFTSVSGWWQDLEGSCFLCIQTPLVFPYYYGNILKPYLRQDLKWRIATSEFVVRTFISFLGLAWAGPSASASGNSCVLRAKKGVLVSFPSRL